MGKFVNKQDYERFVQSLVGPLKSMNGEIYEAKAETFSIFNCYLNIVIRDKEVGPDIISKLLIEIAEKFQPMYDLYMDEKSSGMGNTDVRIRKLILTGGLDTNDLIGINLNDTMSTVLPIEKQMWIKEMYSVKDLLTLSKTPLSIHQTKLNETTVEKINTSLKQLQSQKNVPHNLQVHLDFVEEGTFDLDISNGTDNSNFIKNIYYKLPENIKLKFVCDPSNHNKITGELDFDFKSIYIEFPFSPKVGRAMIETITSVLSDKIKQILKSNDLVPVRYQKNTHFVFDFKWTE